MRVEIVPCLSDNYAYLVIDERANVAAIVDASEEAPVVAALERSGAKPVAILSTHHHFDHVGGNEAIRARFPGISVHGHRSDEGRIPGLSDPHDHGDEFAIAGLQIRALHAPGHTLGALTYVVRGEVGQGEVGQESGPAWAFTGDTMFLGGCGRLFEGTPAQMLVSLEDVIGGLPDDTLIGCGHEYTASNLRFAAHVEPSNADVGARTREVAALRAENRPTVPAPLGRERTTNPFLRVDSAELRKTLGFDESADRVAVFAALRQAKNDFK
ncbi:MAG: hydroxyacylglutathione hydrolase [Polyangiales bacterium]